MTEINSVGSWQNPKSKNDLSKTFEGLNHSVRQAEKTASLKSSECLTVSINNVSLLGKNLICSRGSCFFIGEHKLNSLRNETADTSQFWAQTNVCASNRGKSKGYQLGIRLIISGFY